MISVFRNTAYRAIAFLMIGIMGLMIANRGIYLHSHLLENGSVVTHAHPFDKKQDSKPFKSHRHSAAVYLFLENISVFFPLGFLVLIFLAITRTVSFFRTGKNLHSRLESAYCPSRAPPVL